MIKKIIKLIIYKFYWQSSSERYCKYLRNKGITIGGCNMLRPKSTNIDLTRPSLITIGNNCYFNENLTILTHDWVTKVFLNSGREFLPSSGKVTIGNNVSTGQNVMILKGVTIGDNVFIGANSIVTKNIPSNSIAVGSPARVICTLEEYYQKRKIICVDEALIYARSIKERFGRNPITSDFWEEFPLFIDNSNIDQYPEMINIVKRQCGETYNDYIKNHKAIFNGFEAFLKAAGLQ